MNRAAHVTSIDSVVEFRAALQRFASDVADAVTALELEARRSVDWIVHDRAKYWPAQVRRSSDLVQQARIDLERCELSIRPDDRPSCYEQKKALEIAKRRLRFCEEQVEVVRFWCRTLQHEHEEFRGQLARLNQLLEGDVANADATLQRMLQALDRYADRAAPQQCAAAGDAGPTPAGQTDSDRESATGEDREVSEESKS